MAAANPTIELSSVLYFGGPKHRQWEVMQEPTPSVVRHLSPPTAPVYFTPFEEEQEEEEYPLISTETYHRGELIVDGHTQWVLRHSNVPYLSASDIAEIVRLTRANRMARAADAHAREILLPGDSYTTTLDNEPEFPFNLVRELNHSRGVVVATMTGMDGTTRHAYGCPTLRAQLVASSIGTVNLSDLVSLTQSMLNQRMTIGTFEGVITCFEVSLPMDGFPEASITLEQRTALEHYESSGVVVPVVNPIQAPSSIYNGASMMGTFPAMVTNPPLSTAAEPEPSGVLVPLRNPGEAPRLRKITLPK